MKIEVIDDNYIVYLNKFNIFRLDFKNVNSLESNIKKLLKKLECFYHIDIKGYYNINVYVDKYYGYVFKIKKENDYYNYFDLETVAVKIKKINTNFLYKVDDPFIFDDLNKFKFIKIKDNFYLKVIKKLSYKEYLTLLEFSKIIYDNENDL